MSQLVLASQSPRRTQLLEKAGFSFTSVPISTSELIDEKLNPDAQILSITRQKLEASEKWLLAEHQGDVTVVVADTEVIFKGELLGKPQSTAHALEIIGRLSGNYHFVKTGFIIKNLTSKREVSHIETSLVKFRTLTKQEIFDYVESNDGLGKAGAYGIQGLGRGLVDFHLGSLNNIIGLPVEIVKTILENNFEISVKK